MRFRILIIVAAVVLTAAAALDALQEKPDRPTRTWRAADVPLVDWRAAAVLVDVVDTAGVCVYVARGDGHGEVAIAAVPKTQLPAGTGCQ
jgi:hypothetical protein